jgi:hypothetical protein
MKKLKFLALSYILITQVGCHLIMPPASTKETPPFFPSDGMRVLLREYEDLGLPESCNPQFFDGFGNKCEWYKSRIEAHSIRINVPASMIPSLQEQLVNHHWEKMGKTVARFEKDVDNKHLVVVFPARVVPESNSITFAASEGLLPQKVKDRNRPSALE